MDVADGVLCTPSANWAVEVELAKKGDAEYERILRWYAAEAVTQGYRRVVWYAGGKHGQAVRRRLEALVEREHLGDFMAVLPLPEDVTVYEWGYGPGVNNSDARGTLLT